MIVDEDPMTIEGNDRLYIKAVVGENNGAHSTIHMMIGDRPDSHMWAGHVSGKAGNIVNFLIALVRGADGKGEVIIEFRSSEIETAFREKLAGGAEQEGK